MTDPISTDEIERSRRRTDWMRSAQAGDRESYRTLLDDVGPTVDALLRRILGDGDDAADAYQDTLIALHRYRHTCTPSRPVEPWLFAIARKVARGYLRRRGIQPHRDVPVGVPPAYATELDRGLAPQLRQGLTSFWPSQGEGIALVSLERRSAGEAPEQAGRLSGALALRVHRAYLALRLFLES